MRCVRKNELIKNIEQGGNATVIEELTNQMSIKSQERVSDVLRLADISRANVVDVEKVFTVVMAIFGLLIILTLLWLQKKATARTQDLERANERLRQLDRAKTDFISITSHQLRTPLTALLWLSEEPYPPLDEIKISVRRLATLVEDLLNVSKIQLGKFKDGAQMISLEKIIHETINDVQHYATLKEHAIDFVKKSEQQNIIISINPNALTIIMHNLLTNAIDYGEQKTPITVEIKSTLEHITVTVRNKGKLISPADQARLFDKFFRTEQGKLSNPQGSGLGLFIVKTLVESFGGTVGISSKQGGDIEFWFTLPQATPESPQRSG